MKKCIHCGRRFTPHPEHVKLCPNCNNWLAEWIEWVKSLFDKRPGYFEYIQSPAWKRKADEAKKRAGYRCQVCNSPDNLEAHHNCYDRLGHERNTDLVCLCRRCHQAYHNKFGIDK